MMKNPRNLLIFAILGGGVGLGLGAGLTATVMSKTAATTTSPLDHRKDSLHEIRVMLSEQTMAWNEGDIEGFMASYVKGDALRFASGRTVENGWQTTLERYQRRYPDRATMGTLISETYDVQLIGKGNALVFGRWELEREGDNPSGLYTLHLQDIDGKWVIVSDHTSSAD